MGQYIKVLLLQLNQKLLRANSTSYFKKTDILIRHSLKKLLSHGGRMGKCEQYISNH